MVGRLRTLLERGHVVRGRAINGWTACPRSCERGLGWRPPATGAGQCEASNLSAAKLRQGAALWARGCQPPRTRQLKRGAERPGDIGFL